MLSNLFPTLTVESCTSDCHESCNGSRYFARDKFSNNIFEVRFSTLPLCKEEYITASNSDTMENNVTIKKSNKEELRNFHSDNSNIKHNSIMVEPHKVAVNESCLTLSNSVERVWEWIDKLMQTTLTITNVVEKCILSPSQQTIPIIPSFELFCSAHLLSVSLPLEVYVTKESNSKQLYVCSIEPLAGLSLGDIVRCGWRILDEETLNAILITVEEFCDVCLYLPEHHNLSSDAIKQIMTVRDGCTERLHPFRWVIGDWSIRPNYNHEEDEFNEWLTWCCAHCGEKTCNNKFDTITNEKCNNNNNSIDKDATVHLTKESVCVTENPCTRWWTYLNKKTEYLSEVTERLEHILSKSFAQVDVASYRDGTFLAPMYVSEKITNTMERIRNKMIASLSSAKVDMINELTQNVHVDEINVSACDSNTTEEISNEKSDIVNVCNTRSVASKDKSAPLTMTDAIKSTSCMETSEHAERSDAFTLALKTLQDMTLKEKLTFHQNALRNEQLLINKYRRRNAPLPPLPISSNDYVCDHNSTSNQNTGIFSTGSNNNNTNTMTTINVEHNNNSNNNNKIKTNNNVAESDEWNVNNNIKHINRSDKWDSHNLHFRPEADVIDKNASNCISSKASDTNIYCEINNDNNNSSVKVENGSDSRANNSTSELNKSDIICNNINNINKGQVYNINVNDCSFAIKPFTFLCNEYANKKNVESTLEHLLGTSTSLAGHSITPMKEIIDTRVEMQSVLLQNALLLNSPSRDTCSPSVYSCSQEVSSYTASISKDSVDNRKHVSRSHSRNMVVKSEADSAHIEGVVSNANHNVMRQTRVSSTLYSSAAKMTLSCFKGKNYSVDNENDVNDNNNDEYGRNANASYGSSSYYINKNEGDDNNSINSYRNSKRNSYSNSHSNTIRLSPLTVSLSGVTTLSRDAMWSSSREKWATPSQRYYNKQELSHVHEYEELHLSLPEEEHFTQRSEQSLSMPYSENVENTNEESFCRAATNHSTSRALFIAADSNDVDNLLTINNNICNTSEGEVSETKNIINNENSDNEKRVNAQKMELSCNINNGQDKNANNETVILEHSIKQNHLLNEKCTVTHNVRHPNSHEGNKVYPMHPHMKTTFTPSFSYSESTSLPLAPPPPLSSSSEPQTDKTFSFAERAMYQPRQRRFDREVYQCHFRRAVNKNINANELTNKHHNLQEDEVQSDSAALIWNKQKIELNKVQNKEENNNEYVSIKKEYDNKNEILTKTKESYESEQQQEEEEELLLEDQQERECKKPELQQCEEEHYREEELLLEECVKSSVNELPPQHSIKTLSTHAEMIKASNIHHNNNNSTCQTTTTAAAATAKTDVPHSNITPRSVNGKYGYNNSVKKYVNSKNNYNNINYAPEKVKVTRYRRMWSANQSKERTIKDSMEKASEITNTLPEKLIYVTSHSLQHRTKRNNSHESHLREKIILSKEEHKENNVLEQNMESGNELANDVIASGVAHANEMESAQNKSTFRDDNVKEIYSNYVNTKDSNKKHERQCRDNDLILNTFFRLPTNTSSLSISTPIHRIGKHLPVQDTSRHVHREIVTSKVRLRGNTVMSSARSLRDDSENAEKVQLTS